jgi:histidinol-phosphatase (PHP family)
MLANFHTHSVFCDGNNTPEEIVKAAIQRGFDTVGFSGHGYTPFDLRYCMKDTDGYILEVERLKKMYGKDIEILLGVEEDAFSPVDRDRFDYIIGSSHYFHIGDSYLPIDSNYDYFKKCLAAFDHDVIRMAHNYYQSFCGYIKARKPDIIGHFDLITKFDELDESLFLDNRSYHKVAEQYVDKAAESGCIFEVNTGAIARGFRTRPYPMENLLYVLKKKESKLLLSSDSHSIETLDFAFEETKQYLYDIGFRYLYSLTGKGTVKYSIE